MDNLIYQLKNIEKQNYHAYQKIKGEYDFTDFTLFVDTVQGDPFASASRLRAKRAWSLTDLAWLKDHSADYQRGARDFIARTFVELAKADNLLDMAYHGQTVLDHTAVLFDDEGIELRFRVNLPAEGRQILAKKAINLLTFHLPKMIRKATIARELDLENLKRHCEVIEDQVALRGQLSDNNLIAFIADNSVLARRAGDCDLPMKDAITFCAPDSLAVTLDTPNRGKVRGLGIGKGINLIVGGGYHGKSTLLNAIERGIYDHIPGDGREYVVADASAMTISAEDGRCVHHLNLSNYINHLPMGKDTNDFSTLDASGSTSQAAWLQESIEAGAQTILIDEDTSATNFLIRDQRMQALVAKQNEPITPLVDRIADLRDQQGISTILVMGGSGDYFDVADNVIQLQDYQVLDVTKEANKITQTYPNHRKVEVTGELQRHPARAFNPACLHKTLAEGKFRIQGKSTHTLRFGKEHIDLSALTQFESSSEINAIGWLWFTLFQEASLKSASAKSPSLWQADLLNSFQQLLDEQWHQRLPSNGDLAKPRALDVMAVLNRFRKAEFKSLGN